MFDIDKLVRENIKALIPYSSARDEFKGKEGIFLDANENPFGTLNRYPDPYQIKLRKAICSLKEVPLENIFLGNGSDEVIDLCFRTFCNPGIDSALIFPPTYGMYEVSAGVNDVKLIKVPLTDRFQIDLKNVKPLLDEPYLKLIFICSPNNPTGNSMNRADVEYIISNFKGIVVIDEAYIDFSEFPSYKSLITTYPNLIVMQTFSKALGLAAARIGMAFTDSAIVQYFNKMKPPYNVSTINQNAAFRRINSTMMLKNQLKSLKTQREMLSANLKKLPIIEEVFPSDANFLLVRIKDPDLIYTMLVKKNIIVRNRNKFVQGCIRITIGTGSENRKLVKTLSEIKI